MITFRYWLSRGREHVFPAPKLHACSPAPCGRDPPLPRPKPAPHTAPGTSPILPVLLSPQGRPLYTVPFSTFGHVTCPGLCSSPTGDKNTRDRDLLPKHQPPTVSTCCS